MIIPRYSLFALAMSQAEQRATAQTEARGPLVLLSEEALESGPSANGSGAPALHGAEINMIHPDHDPLADPPQHLRKP